MYLLSQVSWRVIRSTMEGKELQSMSVKGLRPEVSWMLVRIVRPAYNPVHGCMHSSYSP
jgi:hypothetical protein